MFTNPFSPIFGGKPDVFFGRHNILNRFELAMIDKGSDDRAMFFSGTRGCGKTALLEQLSIKAKEKKRMVIDLGPEDTIEQLVAELVGYDETTTTINPQASLSILGMGGGISAGSISKTKRVSRSALSALLIDACKKNNNGILVTVDEIQKVPIEDVSSLCNAFQMASRKGYDIMLAVAGLPYAYSSIIEHEGCTYLRRASHDELGLFTWEETNDALKDVFKRIRGIKIDKDSIDRLNEASYGQPYIMQLLGYYLILGINEANPGKQYTVTARDIEVSIDHALKTYELRALKPLVDELPESDQKYLRAMSEVLDSERLALTSNIAKALDSTANKVGRARAHLIDNGIIAAPEHGKVMFCIPYLASYVKRDRVVSDVVEIARKRRV